MAYTPTTWNTGDTITATKLNKLENGVANAGSALIVTSSEVNGVQTMDKTVQEIYDALMSGTPVYYKWNYGVPSNYSSYSWLAPISYIYTYDTADLIRLAVSRPAYNNGSTTLGYTIFIPSVMIFQASGLNSYPAFLKSITPQNTAVESSTNLL